MLKSLECFTAHTVKNLNFEIEKAEQYLFRFLCLNTKLFLSLFNCMCIEAVQRFQHKIGHSRTSVFYYIFDSLIFRSLREELTYFGKASSSRIAKVKDTKAVLLCEGVYNHLR